MDATKKTIHLLPNVITAFGLTCGLFIIFKMTMVESGAVDYSTLLSIAGILVLAGVADVLDGAVARAIKAESYFGGIFDSLSDAITFGVCPTVIIIKSLSVAPKTELAFFVTVAAMVYSVCGVLRLARFSLLAKQASENPELLKGHQKNFTGLPIPAAAAAAVSCNLIFYSSEFKAIFNVGEHTQAWILIVMLMVLGYLMVSRLKFPSLKNLNIRVASFRKVIVSVVFAVLLFFGFLHYSAIVFFAIIWGYIVLSLTLFVIRLISGRKSKRLEEFEPENDDHFDEE